MGRHRCVPADRLGVVDVDAERCEAKLLAKLLPRRYGGIGMLENICSLGRSFDPSFRGSLSASASAISASDGWLIVGAVHTVVRHFNFDDC